VFTPTAGVPAAPATYGLVASRVDITPPDRWEQGFAWVPERCGAGYELLPWCTEPDGDFTPSRPDAAYYRPVGLRVAEECTTLSGPVDLARFQRAADATYPFAAARELWSGELTQTDPYAITAGGPEDQTNAYLASPDAEVVGSGAIEPLVALGRLEQAAMEASRGQAVMLHVPILVSWSLAGSLTKVGQTYVTVAGNRVIADAGYSGTGPNGQPVGSTVWAYATSPVAVLASPWQPINTDAQTVDRAVNTRTTWVERVIATSFDPCVHLATEIEI
jgi:hypothetical protein